MCTTQFHFITYNTHLFFKGLDIGPLFEDENRRQAISNPYLRTLQPGSVNIAALQEVWYSEFAHEIYKDALNNNSYTNRYVENDQGHTLNKPGLMLLADASCTFKHAGWESYKSECGESPHGWDPQDWPVWKGRVDATCEFQCSDNETHTIGLFTTHMPVGYGHASYTDKVGCSFKYLAGSIQRWRAANPGCAAVLLGDLNIDYYSQTKLPDGNTEYQDAVQGILCSTASLTDAAAAAPTDPGATIVPDTNTLWQKFNGSPVGASNQRIDYFMYADSIDDGTMTVDVTNIQVNYAGLNIQVEENGVMNTYNCSDHYPLEVTATITVSDN